jgi:hypothetical protein
MCVTNCGSVDAGDASPDAGGETLCVNDAGVSFCTSTLTDNANCGGCGITCGLGEVCNSGLCVCAQELVQCGGFCVNTANDKNNCGNCNIVCALNQSCVNGKCM